MGKKLDLIGEKFGRLEVIEKAEYKNGRQYWLCKCACGNTTIVHSSNLRSGNTISCRCAHNDKIKEKYDLELVGKVFGKLTVIERADKDQRGNYKWRCSCSCGNETFVRSSQLYGGNVSSCGCLSRVSGVEGNVYGYFTIIERGPIDKSSRSYLWKCRCVCGKIVFRHYKDLASGHIKSCGCMKTSFATKHGQAGTAEYRRVQNRKRVELAKDLDSSWSTDMELLIRRFFKGCVLCGCTEENHVKTYGKSIHIDHVYPLSKGFGLRPGNAIILCQGCNYRKRDKLPEDLPTDIQEKILTAAEDFRVAWETYKESL